MANAIVTTQRQLEEAKKRFPSCLLAFSGGKDSLVTAELVCKVFDHVEAFFMEVVPGLECVDKALEYGAKRYGFKIHRVPHWATWGYFKHGIYCKARPEMAEIKLDNIYDMVRSQTGIQLIATGAKDVDSMWRRRQLGTWGKKDTMLCPIKTWNKLQVLGYLKANGIALPDSSGKSATGIDLSHPSLLWLHESHPADFARLEKVFPFIRAVVKQAEILAKEGVAHGTKTD